MERFKEFRPTSWSIDNRTSIYILTIIIVLFGIISYVRMQKEQFPDIVIPTIYVGTVYPGTSPTDMENLVTRPIEKELKSLSGVKKISSASIQDFSSISVEFNTDVEVAVAKQRVKDAVDKARSELPNDLPQEPNVMDINFSEIPIMFVNLSGNYSLDKLKDYAEQLQDNIEAMPEITRVDLIGALDREIQVNVDMFKMQAAKVTFNDIARAIQSENMTISGGNIQVGDMQRAIRIVGQYDDPELIGNILVKSVPGAPIYLRDIAEVVSGYKERESYARLDNKPVITLSVVKRSGENLVEAADNIRTEVERMQDEVFPKDLRVVITSDMSSQTRTSLNDLINSIIIGFILVSLILMFFMGTTNALFVGLSVPISMFLAFLIMPAIGFSINMIVLFAFLLALGIVVDDAIVVIENTHRIFHAHNYSIIRSAKIAAGEVFVPVLAGTLTTLAPFFPLAFWPGIVGEFMFYLPITLIITLLASLLVAFIINPVFAVSFMRKEGTDEQRGRATKSFKRSLIILGAVALLFYAAGSIGMGNLTLFIAILVVLNKYVFTRWIKGFQEVTLPRFKNWYERVLQWMAVGHRPVFMLLSVFGLLIFSIILTAIRSPQVVFFPQGDPNYVYVYLNMPIGTDVEVTDSVTRVIERQVNEVLGKDNPDVESVIANVAVGAGDPMDFSRSTASNKGKVTVAFKEFQFREDPHTLRYLNEIRSKVKGIPGAEITVEQEQAGPPVGKPISIEISGDDFRVLARLSRELERFLETSGIQGIEDLRSDLFDKKPEIVININRERANLLGVSTGQIASEVRTAVFGAEASKYKEGEDEFPIQVRYSEEYRKNIDALAELPITFREMTGAIKQIPLSAVADINYSNTYGQINRKDLKRVVTLSSNVLSGHNPNEVVGNIKAALADYEMPAGYAIDMTGEQEQQEETANFLGLAGLIAFLLIFFILVLQFNSVSKPIIILTEIIFSVIGVLLGFAIFGMDISIVMTGVGLVALGGIVVKNGILLVEFSDELRARGLETKEAVIEAGKTRLSPVLLTATATVLGLIPLALGMNINFFTMFSRLDPDFYLGGESMVFWGPLAWTIIFGLMFATFLTLVVVPMMYLLNERLKARLVRIGWRKAEVKE